MSKYTGTPTWEHQNDFFTEICQQRIDDTRRLRVRDCAGDIWLPTSEAEFVSKRVYLKGIAGVQILTIWIIIHYKLKVESWQIYLCMCTRACMHRGMCTCIHVCIYVCQLVGGWMGVYVHATYLTRYSIFCSKDCAFSAFANPAWNKDHNNHSFYLLFYTLLIHTTYKRKNKTTTTTLILFPETRPLDINTKA